MRNDAISIVCRKLGISKEQFRQNYEIIGNSMIIREDDEFGTDERSLGRAMLSSFKLWGIYKYTGIHGSRRIPSVKMISGIHTDVVQSEDGILYMLDPKKIMFSKGNKKERHLLTQMVSEKETILDMFAGIGYFSIPLSFKVRKVYSCDVNPDSFHYLMMNKRLNTANNLVPMLGDSSMLPMEEFADRIVMGHFDSHRYLNSALKYLKKKGSIHLHQLVRRGDELIMVKKYRSYGFVTNAKIRKVKSYSPSHNHVVLDLEVIKH